jgi:hypothetical protein
MTAPRADSPLRDSKTSLFEAAQAAIQDQESKLDAERLARMAATGRRRRIGVMGMLGLVGAVLLIVQPEWLAGPKELPAETPPIAAASMRISLLRERDRVRDYVQRNGRLPATLAQAGGIAPGISLSGLSDGSFTLVGETADSIITLQSGDSVVAFLGESLRIVRNRGRE